MLNVQLSQLWTSSWLRSTAIVLGLGTFLAILGPFGSASIGWPWVWIYWTGLIGLGAVFGFATGHFLPRLAPSLPVWAVYAAAIALVSVPVTLAVLGINTRFFAEAPSVPTSAVTYGLVLVISAFVTLVAWAVERLSASPRLHGQDLDAPPSVGAALVDKLPPGLKKATIQSMSAEDHYLRVRTDAGEALILMRLSDAVAACEALDGARTHRSWWVARDAVSEVRKGDGRATLILSDGIEAPVSRTYYAALRKAEWF